MSPYIDNQNFEQLFKLHYKMLVAYGCAMLRDEDTAEELVQNVFMKIWEKRELLNPETSVKAYLYKCVHNDALNYIKHQSIKLKYQDYASYTINTKTEPASSRVELSELEMRLRQALNELPEQCRTIFQLSRYEELRYKEIAEQLGLSVKTVENQMGKALKQLRIKLADYIMLFLLAIPAIIRCYKDFLK